MFEIIDMNTGEVLTEPTAAIHIGDAVRELAPAHTLESMFVHACGCYMDGSMVGLYADTWMEGEAS